MSGRSALEGVVAASEATVTLGEEIRILEKQMCDPLTDAGMTQCWNVMAMYSRSLSIVVVMIWNLVLRQFSLALVLDRETMIVRSRASVVVGRCGLLGQEF